MSAFLMRMCLGFYVRFTFATGQNISGSVTSMASLQP